MSSRLSELAKATVHAPTALTARDRWWQRAAHSLQVACIVFPTLLFVGLAWIDYRVETRPDAHRRRDHHQCARRACPDGGGDGRAGARARAGPHQPPRTWTSLAASPETHEFLDRLRRELPQVEAIFLVDPNGILAASSRAYPMPRYDVHAPEYFAAAKARNDDAIAISAPFPGTLSGTTGFMISRRRVRDGQLDGVVGVTLSHQYFDTFYRAVLDHPSASAAGAGPHRRRHPGAVSRPARPLRSCSRHPTRCW